MRQFIVGYLQLLPHFVLFNWFHTLNFAFDDKLLPNYNKRIRR